MTYIISEHDGFEGCHLFSFRPNRAEPRCKKRRPKQYDLMNKPRAELRKQLKKQRKKA